MDKKILLQKILLSAVVGAVVETIAWSMQWWIFDPSWLFIPWSFIWEGLFFGTLAFLIRKRPLATQFLVSAAAGGAGEVLSAWFIPFWVFPDNKLLVFEGLPAIVVTLTILWGAYCPLVNLAAGCFFRGVDE